VANQAPDQGGVGRVELLVNSTDPRKEHPCCSYSDRVDITTMCVSVCHAAIGVKDLFACIIHTCRKPGIIISIQTVHNISMASGNFPEEGSISHSIAPGKIGGYAKPIRPHGVNNIT
jgi:hypothetical protein